MKAPICEKCGRYCSPSGGTVDNRWNPIEGGERVVPLSKRHIFESNIKYHESKSSL